MRNYLFIVLLVGVCFGQMKVYSEHPKLVSIQNDKYRGLRIVDSKKIISKLENWLSQKP